MKKKSYGWSVKQVNTMINKGKIKFDNPLQRDPGQWTNENKSLLIDSLITMFVPPIIAIQDGETYDVIDGLQRLTNIHSFIDDEWKLVDGMEPITLTETTGESYEVAGLKFHELPEDLQDAILSTNLTFHVVEIEENDDEEGIITELFKRLNSGSPMSKGHLALVSAPSYIQEFIHKILTENSLFKNVAHFSAGQLKKSDRQMAVMQSIMYISGLDYEDFSATKGVEKFFVNNKEIDQEVLDKTEQAFSLLAEALEEHTTFMTKVRISAFAYVATKAITTGQKEKFKLFTKWYVKNSDKNDSFRKQCGAGNTKHKSCEGRIEALETMFNDFIPVSEEVGITA